MPAKDDTPKPRKEAKKAAKKSAPKKAAAPRKTSARKASSRARATASEPTRDQIAARAYEIYEAEGGDHEQNWLRAEHELRERR
jgi:hypothetical protein